MKRFLVLWSLLSVFLGAQPAAAQAPALLPVQGYLSTDDGTAVDGEVGLEIRIYDSAEGDGELFGESRMVTVDRGLFTVYAGSTSTLDLAMFAGYTDLWLGLRVGDEEEMSPRIRLATVPYAAYAQYAGDATTLAGMGSDAFAPASHTHSFGDLSDVPGGLTDGDDDTTYGAGSGLTLSGTTFAADTSVLQSRVTDTCAAGSAIRAVGSDGTVTCEADDDTTYSAGTGLTLTGTVFSVDPAAVQSRVADSCPAGSSIRSIAADGTVVCESDDTGEAIPTGTILPFAAETVPSGWLPCDGRALDGDDPAYADLHTVIGTRWGDGSTGTGASAATDFNLPDLRGQFLRGAHGAGVDPDGDRAVGTLQTDAYRSHRHGVYDPGHSHSGFHSSSNGAAADSSRPWALFHDSYGSNFSSNSSSTNISIQYAGGAETRPRNAAVMFMIKL